MRTSFLKALFCLGAALALQADQVTFKVDMSVKAAEGLFNPANDTVEARGSFNNWSGGFTLTDPDGDKIYTGTVDVVPGAMEYKFVYLTGGADAHWENIGNRATTVSAGGAVLPVVYFEDDSVVSVAVKVTFKVDMHVKAAEGLFDPASDYVTARGSFNSWGNSFELSDPDGDLIYEGTTDVMVGAAEYKFAYTKGTTDFWESRGNRSLTVPIGGMTVPTSLFDDDAVISVAVPVVFRVDMSVRAAEGTFDPATGTVEARGSFGAWASGFQLEDPDGDKIYEGTINIMAGDNIEYKFVADGGTWESRGNRTATIPNGGTTLPVVFFDDDSQVSVAIQAEVKFEVDMNVQIAAGNFDPSSDEVWVRGGKMGWGTPPGGFQLSPDPARSGVYVGSFNNDSVTPAASIFTGERIEYKYTIWKPATSATVWEDGDNKVIIFDGTEKDTDTNGYIEKGPGLTFFNGISFNDVLKTDTTVLFRVDMSNAQASGAPFIPDSDTVYLNGSYVPWWTWNTAPDGYMLHDDGLDGDAVAGDHIYSLRQVFKKGSARHVVYKYGIFSSDNEAASGNNHERYINADGNYTFPVDVFGDMVKETGGSLGKVSVSLQGAAGAQQIVLTWNGAAGVKLQSTPTLTNPTWTEVTGTDGSSSLTVSVTPGSAKFYRLVR